MVDYTKEADESCAAVKGPAVSFGMVFKCLVLAALGVFAYWKFCVDHPEDWIAGIVDGYHNSCGAATVSTNYGEMKVSDLFCGQQHMPDARIYPREVVRKDNEIQVVVAVRDGNINTLEYVLMRYFDMDVTVGKTGDRTFNAVKVDGKWILKLSDTDIANICARNRELINVALGQYLMSHDNNPERFFEQLGNYISSKPKCLSGGIYSITLSGSRSSVICSKHGGGTVKKTGSRP